MSVNPDEILLTILSYDDILSTITKDEETIKSFKKYFELELIFNKNIKKLFPDIDNIRLNQIIKDLIEIYNLIKLMYPTLIKSSNKEEFDEKIENISIFIKNTLNNRYDNKNIKLFIENFLSLFYKITFKPQNELIIEEVSQNFNKEIFLKIINEELTSFIKYYEENRNDFLTYQNIQKYKRSLIEQYSKERIDNFVLKIKKLDFLIKLSNKLEITIDDLLIIILELMNFMEYFRGFRTDLKDINYLIIFFKEKYQIFTQEEIKNIITKLLDIYKELKLKGGSINHKLIKDIEEFLNKYKNRNNHKLKQILKILKQS